MTWGGKRPGAGRKPRPDAQARPAPRRATPKLQPAPASDVLTRASVPAEASPPAIDPRAWIQMLPEIEEISRRYSNKQPRTAETNPFKLPTFPKSAIPKQELTMAMDNALTQNLAFAGTDWLAGGNLGGVGEGLQFLGYPYLAELAQRPEYRVMSETIADDATRKWIDFDVVGDEKKQREDKDRDPAGYDERMADPDERKKRVEQAGKTDRVKALQDDQLRLEVQDRFYEQYRNDGFFGRSHLFLDIRTTDAEEIDQTELKTPLGDSRDATSKTKVPLNSFKAMRTIEPVWTYPLMYNAINPLRKDWYNPQVWFVQGQEIHGTRIQTFIGHPVPDMLKPAYAFGGLSLSQMAKPYVDIWLQTKQSVGDLIKSFSIMVLMTDLSTLMQPGNVGALLARVAMFNALRDNQGTFVINKNTEDFKNVAAQLGGLHELQAQSQEHVASVHRIPLVKYTGIQPAGLNASSEGEIEVYDDTIGALQVRFADPNLRRVINFQQLSLFGEIDPEITHRWVQLRPMTQEEKGKKEKADAERNQMYVDMGALSPGEVRQIIIDDKDLPYTGLNPDDVPEPPQPVDGEVGAGGDDEPGTGTKVPERDEEHAGQGGGASDAVTPFAFDSPDQPRDEGGKFTFSGGGSGGASMPSRPDAFHGSGQAYQSGKRNDPLYLTNRLQEAAGFARGAHHGGEGEAAQVHSFHMKPGKIRDINKEIDQALEDGDDLDDAITKVIAEELGEKGTARYLQFLHPSVAGGGDFDALIALHPGQDLEHVDSAELSAARAWKGMQKAAMATDNRWARDPITGEAVVLVGDEWNEGDHPRGQPDNAGQFGSGGGSGGASKPAKEPGAGKSGKKPTAFGGLYKETGKGPEADYDATVKYVLSQPPKSGVHYRNLLNNLIGDAEKFGGEAVTDKLKSHLGQAFANARDQLIEKAKAADDMAEKTKLGKMAAKADDKAKALGWKQQEVVLPKTPEPVAASAASWAHDGDASPELKIFREATKDYLIAYGLKNGTEDLTGFDLKTGKPLNYELSSSRGARNVQFSQQLMQDMMDPSNEFEMHHNHPSDTSLSLPDLEVAAHAPGMAKIYAHGHLGSTYWVTGAEKVGLRQAKASSDATFYGDISRLPNVESELKSRIHGHVSMLALAKAGLIHGYGASLAPDLQAWFDSRQGLVKHWVEKAAEKAATVHANLKATS